MDAIRPTRMAILMYLYTVKICLNSSKMDTLEKKRPRPDKMVREKKICKFQRPFIDAGWRV